MNNLYMKNGNPDFNAFEALPSGVFVPEQYVPMQSTRSPSTVPARGVSVGKALVAGVLGLMGVGCALPESYRVPAQQGTADNVVMVGAQGGNQHQRGSAYVRQTGDLAGAPVGGLVEVVASSGEHFKGEQEFHVHESSVEARVAGGWSMGNQDPAQGQQRDRLRLRLMPSLVVGYAHQNEGLDGRISLGAGLITQVRYDHFGVELLGEGVARDNRYHDGQLPSGERFSMDGDEAGWHFRGLVYGNFPLGDQKESPLLHLRGWADASRFSNDIDGTLRGAAGSSRFGIESRTDAYEVGFGLHYVDPKLFTLGVDGVVRGVNVRSDGDTSDRHFNLFSAGVRPSVGLVIPGTGGRLVLRVGGGYLYNDGLRRRHEFSGDAGIELFGAAAEALQPARPRRN